MKLKYFLTFLFLGLLSNAYAQKWAEVFETGGSYLEVKKAFYNEWKDKPYVRSSGYKPFKRFENFYEERLYPEYKWPNPMQVWNEYNAVAGKMPISATNQWQPIGPTSWTDGAGWNAGLGRINVVYVDPNNPSIIYVGAPSGGLWKSTNGGSTWTCLTDDQPVLGVSDMEIDPNNSNVIYLATGDGDATNTYSVGVIKSTNGGLTWNTTGLNFQVTQTRRIRRLIMHPTDADILFAATTNGLYRTTNGGTSWTQISTNNYQDLSFKPGDPNTVYAVNDKFFKSTDGGTSFTQITSGLPPDNEVNRYKIGVSADEPNYVYIVCGKQGDSTFKGMYRSTNSGNSFSLQANSPNIFGYSQDGSDNAGQSWYDLAIVVDPNDANTMWVGGVNIWKSTDGGVTYFPQTHWIYPNTNGYTHADIHYLQMYNGSIYVGSDGGVFISSDGGNTWTDKTLGIQITQFYRISTSQSNPDKVIGGTQDNGTNLYGGSLNWTHVVGADGMECIINPSNDNIVYACIQNGSIRKSTNGGNTFTAMFNPGQVNETAAWVTPYVLDPDNFDHMYVGYTELYKSTNAGGSFTQISNLNNSTPLNHIHVAEADTDVIYLGRKQNVLKSTDGGLTFSTVTGNLPNKNITGIITDPTDANRVWVSISGYLANNKVFYSSTGGSSWTNLSTGLLNIPANCLLYRPGSSDEIYVGTDLGVYYLTGNTGSWQLFGLGLPNVVVRDLEYTGGVERMRAGTYGRGLWEVDLPDNCLTDIIPPTINCPNSVPVYYPTQSNTCDQLVNLPPSTATDNCDNAPDLSWRFIETDISGLPLSGAVYSPYYTTSNYTFDVGYYNIDWKAEDDSGNTNNCDYQIEIRDVFDPQANCINEVALLDAMGQVQVTVGQVSSGPTDNCAISQVVLGTTQLDCTDLGPNDINVLALDVNGNVSSCNAILTVADQLVPEAICIPNLTVGLNNGSVTISTAQIDAGSYDNCSIVSSSIDQTTFGCEDLGVNFITLEVFDQSGNSNTCVTELIVESFFPVVALCQDITVFLNDAGTVDVDPGQVDSGSSCDCGTLAFSLDLDTFDCDDLGPNDAVLTVSDGLGNSESCVAVITVDDAIPPLVQCMNNINFSLDINGDVSINTTDIVDQVSDNCDANPILTLDQTSFNCSDLGSNSVVLTATDSEQNSSTCSSAINIVEDISPALVCSDITVELDSTDQILVNVDQIVTSVLDNCDVDPTFSPTAISFNCNDLGQNIIEITATDASGNGTLCEANILVTTNTTPVAICVDAFTVNLDENGVGSLNASDVDDGSYTSCESVQLSLDITEFDCTHVGADQVATLLVSNNSGGEATCAATITVVDDLAPILECTSIEVELDNNGAYVVAPEELVDSASDNCSNITFTSPSVLMDCDSIGLKIIEVVGEDDSGNASSCLAFVTVSENIPPVAICMDIEVELDANGTVTLDPSVIAGASQDNCGSVTLELVGEETYDCSVSGTVQTISILVEDSSENVSECEASVSFADNISPNAVCQSAEVFIQGGGMVELDPILFDGGSEDNCAGLQFSVAPASFSCDDLGTQTITLTVSDEGGNSNDCSIDITISDNNNPIAECADNTSVELNDDGNRNLDIDDVYAGNGLSCNGVDYFIEPAQFDCTDIGFPTLVTLGIVGANNDTTTCSTTLDVLDVTKPEAVCETVDVALTDGSELTLFPEMLAGNSSDICSDSIYYQLDSLVLTCEDIGTSIVPIIVVDISGNFDTCSATIHLINDADPIAVCNDTEAYLDENGETSISLEDVTSNATDACGNEVNLALFLSATTFNCEDVGLPQEVELEVVDQNNGNSATCQSLVTVLDTIPPTITSVIDTVLFEYDGVETVTFSGDNFNVMHTDNCEPGDFVVKRNTGACGDGLFNPFIEFCVEDVDGIYPVTFRQFDGNGNYVDIIVYVELDNLLVATNEININTPDIFCTPNPFMESTYLNIKLEELTDIQINVYALDGKTVFSSNRKLESGDHNILIELEGQSSGLYICHVQSLDWESSIKIIKVK